MKLLTNITLKAIASVLILLSATACTAPQNSPTMLDYSYVPPTNIGAPVQNWGIDDF